MIPSNLYCDNCGTANRPQAKFCVSCGQRMLIVSSLPPTVLPGQGISVPTGRRPPNSLLRQRYRIIGPLGQGGMGAVYKAADTQLGGRLVAIKEMSQSGLKPQEIMEAMDAFKREALMLADLRQQNLPRIYDHFADTGRWYLVMDYIEGQTLEEYLTQANSGRLPVEDVLNIGMQLCTVLGYLHAHQPPIIFRDLKPANVMLTTDKHVYLIDFGIARHFKPGQAKDTAAFISVGYAAPEQYGKAQTSPQSDIYSLGATLHQLLSGTDPSQTPFFFAPLATPALPAGLGSLIMRMVDMDVSNRPDSTSEVKQELQRIVSGQGNLLQPGIVLPRSPLLQIPSVANQGKIPAPKLAQILLPPLGTILSTYSGHSGTILSVAWSPDGTHIASASGDKTVQVWDATTANILLTYHGHSDYVRAIAWSPDGTRIASASDDGTAQVWNAVTADHILTYNHGDAVNTVAWSLDGQLLASAGNDQTVQVWDTAGHTIFTYEEHDSDVLALAWSPVGQRIASAGSDQTILVWDAKTGFNVDTYRGQSDIWSIAWSPDGQHLAASLDGKTIQVWQAE